MCRGNDSTSYSGSSGLLQDHSLMKLPQTMDFTIFKDWRCNSLIWTSKTLKTMHMHKCFAKLGFSLPSKYLERA